MWEHFSCKRSKAKKFRELADEEKQAGIQGQWQEESPAKEYLERVIVQCVVSLLFLATQCTHSAIVNARPVARAWNLALRLTSSALGQ